MIRWQPRRRSGSFENDDIRRSLEMLDEILAEYEQDSDGSSNNDRSPTENGQYAYVAEPSRTHEPPPPEEAARVIVSYLPSSRYQNGTEEGSLSNDLDADDFPPMPREQDLNVDSCNNNNNNTSSRTTVNNINISSSSSNAYTSFDTQPSYATGDYHLYEEKQKLSNRITTMSRLPAEDKYSPSGHRNQTPYFESRFPEFPEFQLRMTGEGNYRTDDDPEDGGSYVDMTYPPEESSEDYQYRTGYLDESGDSEDRSSEECSSVIEVPLANRAGIIHPVKDPYQREPVGEEGGMRTEAATVNIVPIERPEDYVKVHPKKYFEDYPADYPQVYPLDEDEDDDDHCGQKGGTMFVLTGQMEGEGDFLEALPPPPAFVNAEDDVDDDDSNRDSPAFIDDADIFYDLTRSAVQCNGDHAEDDDDDENDDEDDGSKLKTMETEESDLQSVEDDDEVEDKLGSWEEELINQHFCSLHDDDDDDLIDYREDDNATPTNTDARFEEVQKLYREGSLDGMDEAPPEFKPPPPPPKRNGDASRTGSSPSDASDDADEDETDVRWKIPLPKGVPFVFGTTILVVNAKHHHQPDGILPSMASDEETTSAQATPTKTSSHQQQQQRTLGHERKLSAEILGLEKLPDVRSLVSSFQKKEIQERAPPVIERRISQEYVGALRKELPLFTPIKPLAAAPPGTSAAPPSATAAKASTTATSKPPLVAPKSSYAGTPNNTAVVVPAPMPPLTLSYPTHSATASLKRRAREQASKITLANLEQSRPKHTRQFSVPLEPSILLPNRTSDNDVPTLLSYRVVNGDNLPPLPLVKGATLPRPSHDPRKSGHRVAPDTTTAASVSPTHVKKELTLRRTPPPPPPLSKGPPPKIFVEVQPSRSESSCTSSCSCLCMKHQSPCNSPVPPPMPSHKLAEIIKNDLKRSNSAPGDNTDAITDDQGRSKGRGRGFNGQLKWPKRHQSQQQQQQQQIQQQQQQPQTLTRASTSADKISNEPYDALIMEIQAAIQHRKTGQEGKDDTGSEGSVSRINTPKMQPITSSPMSMSSVSDKDKSLDRKGLFRGIWRRGRSDEHKN